MTKKLNRAKLAHLKTVYAERVKPQQVDDGDPETLTKNDRETFDAWAPLRAEANALLDKGAE